MIRLSTVSILFCLLIMAGAVGCSNRQADSAAAEAKVVDAVEFQELAEAGGEDVVILDVRTPGEFSGGHVPGAVNVDISASDFEQKIAALDPDKTYLVYCRSGGRSARACSMMAKQAIPAKAIYDLDAGITAWESAGNLWEPITKLPLSHFTGSLSAMRARILLLPGSPQSTRLLFAISASVSAESCRTCGLPR